MKRKLLIDTDPGVDDALAIYFALGSKAGVLEKVTTCFGNSDLKTVTKNARLLISAVDPFNRENVTIHAGAAAPLQQDALHAVVHGAAALGAVIPPIQLSTRVVSQSEATAEQAIEEFLTKSGLELKTLVAIAPLTNIAGALRRAPSSFLRAERIVILGGTLTAPGNKGPVAEFNFRSDPEAADYVFANYPGEIVMIPLDLCYKAVLTVNELSNVENPAMRAFLHQLCETYASANAAEEGIEGIIMYDPLAVFCALYPQLFEFENYWVRVDTGSSYARGASIVDRRPRSDLKRNVRVAIGADLATFSKYFFEAINNLTFDRSVFDS